MEFIAFTDKDDNNIITKDDVLQENHYYPFGMNMEGNWTPTIGTPNDYQYNGKELNQEFGLDLYAYGFRMYDAKLGRFTGVDPISDKFPWVSTFNYAENDPIGAIDLHGLQRVDFNLVGSFKIDGSYYRAVVAGTIDIGDNYKTNVFVAVDDVGSFTFAYNKRNGWGYSFTQNMPYNKLMEKIEKPGRKMPDWAVRKGLDKMYDLFTPESVEESFNLTDEELKLNRYGQMLATTLKELSKLEIYDGYVGRDGSTNIAENESLEPYKRKFTWVYSGHFEEIEISYDGITYNGKLIVSFTDQKCLQNCDDEEK